MKPCNLTKLLFAFLCIGITGFSFSQGWNISSGGNTYRNGYFNVFGPQEPAIRWQGSLNAVFSQQSVSDGDYVIVSRTHNINDVLQGTKIVAHNLQTGDTAWTKILPVDFPSTDWRSRVSAARNGVVYATRSGNTNASYLYALDIHTGAIIWKSQELVDESSTEGVNFAPDGDILAGNFTNVMRINKEDGSTQWKTDRYAPSSDGSQVAVFGGRCYTWEAAYPGPMVTAFDIETGQIVAHSPKYPGLVQQVYLFAGNDGIIYAPRQQNNPIVDSLYALVDKGDVLDVKWSFPIAYTPFATMGVLTDGSVLAFSRDGALVRLDPDNGSVMNTSAEKVVTASAYFPRTAVDFYNTIYITDGGYPTGKLYAFNEDLTLKWVENIPKVNLGGPNLTCDGTLIVNGTGTDLRAYEGNGAVGITLDEPSPISVRATPNPFTDDIEIKIEIKNASTLKVDIVNQAGEVCTHFEKNATPGIHPFIWDGKLPGGLPALPGFYIARIFSNQERISIKILKAR